MKLIVGCGFLGSRVARLWLQRGCQVAAVTRSRQRAELLAADGLEPVVADVTEPATLRLLPAAETVLWAVGWTQETSVSRQALYVDGLRNVLQSLDVPPHRLIFISSTGVYGQAGGECVDEDSPTSPTRESGKALLDAEQVLASHPLGRRAIVLRMAGLYGPGRLLRTDELLAGRPLTVPSGRKLNLIHVDDAASAVLAAEARAEPPARYLVSDGCPVDRREYFRCVAELIGAPPPRFVEPDRDQLSRSHGASDKRVSNDRMLRDLKVNLLYPNYRTGLGAILGGQVGQR
ncbi:MAG: NAD-dependent epimerase/dehydratase family protein [Planctomycetota bacterium]